MSKRLFVGKLPWSVTSDELAQVFAEFPSMVEGSAIVISDRETGRSKGFGFVEIADDAEALAAIEKYNGYTMGNLQITVNEARPKEEGGNRGGGFGAPRGGSNFGGGNRGGNDRGNGGYSTFSS